MIPRNDGLRRRPLLDEKPASISPLPAHHEKPQPLFNKKHTPLQVRGVFVHCTSTTGRRARAGLLLRQQSRLHTVAYMQLLQNVGHIMFDGLLGQE